VCQWRPSGFAFVGVTLFFEMRLPLGKRLNVDLIQPGFIALAAFFPISLRAP
jgi:hypothetical protein